jgi:hypothetical protein
MAATSSATLLLIDAWFDTLTATIGSDYTVSLVSAVGVEVPLACLSRWSAFRAGRRYFAAGAGKASDPAGKRDDAFP